MLAERDARTFGAATVQVELTQNNAGSDWGNFVVTFTRETAAASPTPRIEPVGPEGQLRKHIPASIVATCSEPEGATGEGLLITLRCESGGFEIYYSLFDTTANAVRLYDINREFSYDAPISRDVGNCAVSPPGETSWFDDAGAYAGRLTCAITLGGDPEISWVHEALRVDASVEFIGSDGDYGALYAFWQRLGPVLGS